MSKKNGWDGSSIIFVIVVVGAILFFGSLMMDEIGEFGIKNNISQKVHDNKETAAYVFGGIIAILVIVFVVSIVIWGDKDSWTN